MNKKISVLKKQYETLEASEELLMRMKKEVRKSKIKRGFKISAGWVAAFVAAVGIAANVNPSFAYAMNEVPIINQIVRVVTLNKYENTEGGYEIKIKAPAIEGLLDKEIQEKLNQEFAEQAQSVIVGFEQSVKELKKEFGDEVVHMGIEYNYDVKTDNDAILALDTYVYYASGSSTSVHNYYTIDKKTGELFTLKGLFKEDADYVTPISKYITKEMERRNAEEEGLFWIGKENMDGFEKIAEDQKFYLNKDGNIVICFDKYEVAAGAQGTPEFVIPNEVVRDILK